METTSSPGRMALGLLILLAISWAVLRAGAQLQAPPPLGSEWALDTPVACAAGATALTLSQSGIFLDVRWPGGPAESLHGRWSEAGVVLVGESLACGSAEVQLAGTWAPDRLDARIVAPGCACDGAAVRASRAAP